MTRSELLGLFHKIQERKAIEFYRERSHYAFLLININSMLGGKEKKIEDLIGTLPEYLKTIREATTPENTVQPEDKITGWRNGAALRGLKAGTKEVK